MTPLVVYIGNRYTGRGVWVKGRVSHICVVCVVGQLVVLPGVSDVGFRVLFHGYQYEPAGLMISLGKCGT